MHVVKSDGAVLQIRGRIERHKEYHPKIIYSFPRNDSGVQRGVSVVLLSLHENDS